jgi:hypothetical protein
MKFFLNISLCFFIFTPWAQTSPKPVISLESQIVLNQLKEEFNRRTAGLDSTQKQKLKEMVIDQILFNIDRVPDYRVLESARLWSAYHAEAVIPELIQRLSVRDSVGLNQIYDLQIPERVALGHMPKDTYGKIVENDLFTVAGRANWLLQALSGKSFAKVGIQYSISDAEYLTKAWSDYYKLPCCEIKKPAE